MLYQANETDMNPTVLFSPNGTVHIVTDSIAKLMSDDVLTQVIQ
jgi:hypothetical protein